MEAEKKALLFYSLGIFISYFVYGLIQEKITRSKYGPYEEPFNYTLSMVFIQCIVNALFSKIAVMCLSDCENTIPKTKFIMCSFSYIGAMFMSNYSLQHVNYPTQVVGKSIKPIPVMILGVLWAKKRYSLKKWLFVLMITFGLLLFLWKETTPSNTHHAVGIGEFCLLISLALDGFTGGVQEEMRSKFQASSYSVMYNMNKFSLIYLIAGILLTGEWKYFIPFAMRYPEVLVNILLFGAASAIGQMFIFAMVMRFGPLMLSIVTTSRKFFTILVSVLLFKHAMLPRQWLGTVLVFAGLICDQIWGKDSHKHSHHRPQHHPQDSNSVDEASNKKTPKTLNGSRKTE